MAIQSVIEQALRLSVEERTELVTRLLESLDDNSAGDPGHDAAWTEVIDRRLEEAREGRVELVDASVATARARAAASRRR